jgi:hypothetical protein
LAALTTPAKHRSKAEFLARIDHAFAGDPIIHTAESVSIAFQFLSTKIGAGEIAHLAHLNERMVVTTRAAIVDRGASTIASLRRVPVLLTEPARALASNGAAGERTGERL